MYGILGRTLAGRWYGVTGGWQFGRCRVCFFTDRYEGWYELDAPAGRALDFDANYSEN